MRTARNAGRAVVIATALLGALVGISPSDASVQGSVTASQAVTSASWAVVPTKAASAPYGNGALSLDFGTPRVQTIFFNVVNTGSISLTGATYRLSAVGMPTGSTVTLYACAGGVWNQSTFSCSGTVTQLVSSSGTLVTASVATAGLYPQAVGGLMTVLAFLSAAPQSTTVATVGVSVSRSTQVRAGQTTNG